VGKTTCAAAIAVAAAGTGRRTLVISTDPAPSLGDAFECTVGPEPGRIRLRRGFLDAVEIDAGAALKRWIRARRARLERIALRGTWLDEDDVSRLLRLTLPGIDELAALFEVVRFARTGRYDLIVVDTAPTGHTLRMFAMPETLQMIARAFDEMQSKHRVLVEALRGQWTPDREDALVEEIDRDGAELRALLRDPVRVRVSWVTLPEPMAVEETVDAAAALRDKGIPLADVIVNRLTPARERPCSCCDRRRILERAAVAAIRKRLTTVPVIAVGARPFEPTGLHALEAVGREIEARIAPAADAIRKPSRAWRAVIADSEPAESVSILSREGTRLLLFGGKGGVGKTTCAAAAAIAMAQRSAHRRVFLVSADPAHSLADALGSAVSAVAAPLRGAPANLQARELDAAAAFRAVRARYAEAIDALFDRLSRGSGTVGVDAGHDRRVMHALFDLAPPGIDELAAVIEVIDVTEADPTALVVMDTAPSGHALRLLEMPALVQDWTRALMSMVLKYQAVTGVGDFGAMLLTLSRGLGRLRALLSDPRRAAFVVVTRGARLPRAETVRLIARLKAMDVHVPAVVVNAVGRGSCAACRREAATEQREIRALRRSFPRAIPVLLAPAQLPPPRGAGSLRAWHSRWRM
jgi:arsenite-transporting ATPase